MPPGRRGSPARCARLSKRLWKWEVIDRADAARSPGPSSGRESSHIGDLGAESPKSGTVRAQMPVRDDSRPEPGVGPPTIRLTPWACRGLVSLRCPRWGRAPRRGSRCANTGCPLAEDVAPEYVRFVAAQRRAGRAARPPVAMAPGDLDEPIDIDPDSAGRLLAVAAKRAAGLFRPTKRTEVVWVDGDSELAVGVADVDVQLDDGLIVVTIPVRCDQTEPATVDVTFAVGAPRPPGRAVRRRPSAARAARPWSSTPGARRSSPSPGSACSGSSAASPAPSARTRAATCSCRSSWTRHARRPADRADGPPPLLGSSARATPGAEGRPSEPIDAPTTSACSATSPRRSACFDANGDPNPDWFGDPEASLKTMLADDEQREALIAFVDEAMGGADRDTDPTGVDLAADRLARRPRTRRRGHDRRLARRRRRTSASASPCAPPPRRRARRSPMPLFRAEKARRADASATRCCSAQPGGRIRLATSITVDTGAARAGRGAARGASGSTSTCRRRPSDPRTPCSASSLDGFQLPGATDAARRCASPPTAPTSSTTRCSTSCCRSSRRRPLARRRHRRSAPSPGCSACGRRRRPRLPDHRAPDAGRARRWRPGWTASSRRRRAAQAWLGHLADLLGGTRDRRRGRVRPRRRRRADARRCASTPAPSGNTRLTPTLGVELGNDDARVEARADLCTIDLVTGAATALPALGVWAAAGAPGRQPRPRRHRTRSSPAPTRCASASPSTPPRRLTFVLAADDVRARRHTTTPRST